jgi:hypothetical protein
LLNVQSETKNKILTEPAPDNIKLTAADCFMLALEKQHIRKTGLSNNTCRYLLELSGYIGKEELFSKINAHPDLQWLASIAPEKRFPMSIPAWRKQVKTYDIPVGEYTTDDLIPEAMINERITSHEPPFLRFDLLHRSDGNTALVFSWHHLLMDGYGATLLLRQLATTKAWPRLQLVDNSGEHILPWAQLKNATRAKFFVDRISRKPLSTIAPHQTSTTGHQKIRLVRFTAEETQKIDSVGPTLGAQFGRSALYLGCTSRAVNQLLKDRGQHPHDLWIPVPRDQRKKGAQGPLVGNHLSFLFYRLKKEVLNSLLKSVQSINEQMVSQIKTKMFSDYDILMRYLRRTPSPLYYFWIKGPQGGSLASFLFTVSADHPDDFTSFANHKIQDSWSFPSNIYPPGLTFAFMRYRDCLHLMILYFDDVLTTSELDKVEAQLRHELITGTHYDG